MNKRAKFSLALLVFGLLIQFSPARSQTKPVEQATRPRTVTPQQTQRQATTTQTPAATRPPVTSSLPAQQQDSVVAIQPARPLSMNKINARLDEAKRLLKSRPALTAMTSTNTTPALSVVTLAVLDEKSSQIHLLTIPKESF